jgi:hypothetical protein
MSKGHNRVSSANSNMNFDFETWPIEKLLDVYSSNKIILDPPYQRNDVWSLKAQQGLLDTILVGQPIPNLFLLLRPDGMYEVVDGQQRLRTILGYWKNLIPDLQGYTIERRAQTTGDRKAFTQRFYQYPLSVCVLKDLAPGETVEHFYTKVNSTGLRLNRPELKKAEFLTTNFLRLVQQLTQLPELVSLRLFSSMTSARMNDIDFISELVTALKFGLTDKKDKVDELYQDDIPEPEFDLLFARFRQIILIINRFDRIRPIIRTRYKQKNDFYSLFYFVSRNAGEDAETLDYFYKVLIKLGPLIRPSLDGCEPLKEYAFNCVTQSNSKLARTARHEILSQILLNPNDVPNNTQKQIIAFLDMKEPMLRKVGPYYPLNCESISYPEQVELSI